MMIYVCNEKEKGIFSKIYLILEGSTTKAADDNFCWFFLISVIVMKIRLDITCESSAGRRFTWNINDC